MSSSKERSSNNLCDWMLLPSNQANTSSEQGTNNALLSFKLPRFYKPEDWMQSLFSCKQYLYRVNGTRGCVTYMCSSYKHGPDISHRNETTVKVTNLKLVKYCLINSKYHFFFLKIRFCMLWLSLIYNLQQSNKSFTLKDPKWHWKPLSWCKLTGPLMPCTHQCRLPASELSQPNRSAQY
jgi:hypothetical protein